jgi:hypothetical protein
LILPIKAFVLILAAVAIFALALVVLIGDPSDPWDYNAWSLVITAAGFLVVVWPERVHR